MNKVEFLKFLFSSLVAYLHFAHIGSALAQSVDFELTVDQRESREFGNRFNAATDTDGIVSATFSNTSSDLTLSVIGFDIDFTNEVEVRLNGRSLGFLSPGPNDRLNSGDSFSISAAEQQNGTNTLIFEQKLRDTYKWGITDILLSADDTAPPPPPAGSDIALTIGTSENGSFGNSFDGRQDADGLITATFQSNGAALELLVTGFDIDFRNEVEVRLNGTRLGDLSVGPNNGLNAGDVFLLSAAQQTPGTNIIVFEQKISDSYKWGVTDILVRESGSNPPPPPPPTSGADIDLVVGIVETGEFGNRYNGQFDADGVISAEFTNPGADIELSVVGFDIDFATEVEVQLNGNSLGFMRTGPDNGLTSANVFALASAFLNSGTNSLAFIQRGKPSYRWGVTDILVRTTSSEPPPPPPSGTDIVLTVGVVETGEFGNSYNGKSDADGVIEAMFENAGTALQLSVVGFDIDFADEVEVRLNGNALGFLRTGPNNGLTAANLFSIPANVQVAGTNTLTFEQAINDGFRWGFTDILLSEADMEPPPPPPSGVDVSLRLGVQETGEFGNSFNGATDADGIVTVTFEDTDQDLILSVVGFDIDFGDEVEVRLNGSSLGFLRTGPNNGLNAGETFAISAGQQSNGTNELVFEQKISDSYKWGVTDILLTLDNGGGGSGSGGGGSGGQPDIILFLADDVGSTDMGPTRIKSGVSVPNFNQLAREGIQFTNGYAQPACVQARVALVTGKWPQRRSQGGVVNNGPYPPASILTIAERLRPLGYDTHIVGKWHMGLGTGTHPLDQGFDTFYGFRSLTPNYIGPDNDNPLIKQRTTISYSGNVTTVLANEAIRLLQNRDVDPLFLFVSWTAAHVPLQGSLSQRINEIDRETGRIINAADPDSLFIFLGDNGRANDNEPLRGGKRDILEGGVRVPFALRWTDKVGAGQTVATPASIVDIAPTIVKAAGGRFDDSDGFDLLNLPKDRGVYFKAFDGDPGFGVRRQQWKFYRNYQGKAFQLYDVTRDPDESNNVAGINPSIVNELDNLLDGFVNALSN